MRMVWKHLFFRAVCAWKWVLVAAVVTVPAFTGIGLCYRAGWPPALFWRPPAPVAWRPPGSVAENHRRGFDTPPGASAPHAVPPPEASAPHAGLVPDRIDSGTGAPIPEPAELFFYAVALLIVARRLWR